MVTLIGMTVLLLALAVLAERYGVDSRPGLLSAEQRLAAHGFVWTAPATTRPVAGLRQIRHQPHRPDRLARVF